MNQIMFLIIIPINQRHNQQIIAEIVFILDDSSQNTFSERHESLTIQL